MLHFIIILSKEKSAILRGNFYCFIKNIIVKLTQVCKGSVNLNIVYLSSIILGISAQNIFKRQYTDKTNGKGAYLFSALISLFAMLFFVVTSKGFQFEINVLPYALAFGFAYAIGTLFATLSVSCGSLSLTSLFISYSLLLPTFYGLIFLKDPVSIGLIPGIILLVISLILTNKPDKKSKISFKWIIFVALAFIGNGMCSTVQKIQQVKFDGAYKNEFMIVAIAFVAISLFIFAIFKEKGEIKIYAKSGWFLALLSGLINGMVNLFVMILSGRIPVSLMFPLISAGGIIITYFVSKFYYKEKLSKMQFIGFLIGIASVVFLNI